MKFRNITTLIISFAVMLAICIGCGFWFREWLGYNVFPIDTSYDPYYWSEIFLNSYWCYLGGAVVLNTLFIISHKSKTPQLKWLLFIITDTIISFIVSIPFFVIYPIEDVIIYWFATLGLALLTGPVTFFITTIFAPWDSNPWAIR